MRGLRAQFEQRLEEAMEHARLDKENCLRTTAEANFHEVTNLTNNLTQCQDRVAELEDALRNAENSKDTLIKEALEKVQNECKTELETIRSRFKLMAASTMERSPSDQSLEKIDVSAELLTLEVKTFLLAITRS